MAWRTPKLSPALLALPLLAAASSSLGCDAARQGANPEVPLWVHRPGSVLELLFQKPLTIEGRNRDEAYERGRPTIDAPHARVFVGSSDHGLYALRAEDATTLWRFETLGAVQSEPLYDPREDVVYFGSNDGALYKVRAKDGKLLWRFMSYAEVMRQPVLHRGLLVFSNANDTVIAVDPATGEMRWNYHRAPIGGMSVAGYAGVAVWRDKVYSAFSDGHVMAFDVAEGAPMWPPVDLSAEAEQTLGFLPKYFDVDTTPIVDRIGAGTVVYVGSYAGGTTALDAQSGARVWANDQASGVTDLVLWTQPPHTPRDGGPAIPARKLLLAASGTTGLWALNPEDGTEVWRNRLPAGGVSAPVPVAGALMVSTSRYGLFLLSPLNGKVIDGIDLGMRLSMVPAAHGFRAFLMSDGGAWLSLHVTPPDVAAMGTQG